MVLQHVNGDNLLPLQQDYQLGVVCLLIISAHNPTSFDPSLHMSHCRLCCYMDMYWYVTIHLLYFNHYVKNVIELLFVKKNVFVYLHNNEHT